MSEELERRILESLDKILEWLERAGNFASEQAPLLVAEMIRYGFWMSLTIGVVSWLLAGFAFWAYWYGHERGREVDWQRKGMEFPPYTFWRFLFALLLPAFLALAMLHTVQFFKVALAPRLYILEAVRGML